MNKELTFEEQLRLFAAASHQSFRLKQSFLDSHRQLGPETVERLRNEMLEDLQYEGLAREILKTTNQQEQEYE